MKKTLEDSATSHEKDMNDGAKTNGTGKRHVRSTGDKLIRKGKPNGKGQRIGIDGF